LKVSGQRLSVRELLSLREGAVFVVTVVLFATFASINGGFMTVRNVKVLGDFIAGNVAVAAAQVMLMIVGEIDLSVGAVYALSPYLMYLSYAKGLSYGIGIPLALLAAASVGLANGVFTVKLRVPSLITTLGMNLLISGVNILMSGGETQVLPEQQPYTAIFGGSLVRGIEITFIWTALALLILAVVLARMRHGIWSIATGSNLLGAKEVGVNASRTKIRNFVIASSIAGLWGIFIANRSFTFGVSGLADPAQGGDTLTLESIAAAVIGGTSLFGGSGTVIGALLGSLLIAVLQDGLILSGAGAFIYQTLLGVAIILSMALNVKTRRWLTK